MARFDIDLETIRQLASLLGEADLNEVEIEQGRMRLRLTRRPANPPESTTRHEFDQKSGNPAIERNSGPVSDPVHSENISSSAPTALSPKQKAGIVTSPMVGIAYLGPEPGAEPFVTPGNYVRKGQTIMIIEAMKTMNPIQAPHDGKVIEIMTENSKPVEFGEPLFIIE